MNADYINPSENIPLLTSFWPLWRLCHVLFTSPRTSPPKCPQLPIDPFHSDRSSNDRHYGLLIERKSLRISSTVVRHFTHGHCLIRRLQKSSIFGHSNNDRCSCFDARFDRECGRSQRESSGLAGSGPGCRPTQAESGSPTELGQCLCRLLTELKRAFLSPKIRLPSVFARLT